jgi:hypothetical protein
MGVCKAITNVLAKGLAAKKESFAIEFDLPDRP